jgi:hypothetical protein
VLLAFCRGAFCPASELASVVPDKRRKSVRSFSTIAVEPRRRNFLFAHHVGGDENRADRKKLPGKICLTTAISAL